MKRSLPQDVDRDPERFTGAGLPANAHVAVLFCDSIGDFVVALPLLQAIRETYPESVVDYFGGVLGLPNWKLLAPSSVLDAIFFTVPEAA